MRKPDEILLYKELRAMVEERRRRWDKEGISGSLIRAMHGEPARTADDVFEAIGMNQKRGYSILTKWSDRGWWEYGVSLRTGWFTPEAPQEIDR